MGKFHLGPKHHIENLKGYTQQAFPISQQIPLEVQDNSDLILKNRILELEEQLNQPPLEIIKEVPVEKTITLYETKEVEVIKEVPVYIEKIVPYEVIKEVEKPVIHVRDIIQEKIIEVPKNVFHEKIPNWCYGLIAVSLTANVILMLLKIKG